MFLRKPGSMVSTVESPAWLIKRIAWPMQANHEGGLTERARQRARELACDADLRLSAPRMRPQPVSVPAAPPQPITLQKGGRSWVARPREPSVRREEREGIASLSLDFGFW